MPRERVLALHAACFILRAEQVRAVLDTDLRIRR